MALTTDLNPDNTYALTPNDMNVLLAITGYIARTEWEMDLLNATSIQEEIAIARRILGDVSHGGLYVTYTTEDDEQSVPDEQIATAVALYMQYGHGTPCTATDLL